MKSAYSASLIILALAGGSVSADSGDPIAGRALAGHLCAECHLIAGADPNSSQRGPSFSSLSADPDLTDSHLRDFLKKPHGEMPDIPLTSSDIEDLVSYISAMDE